MMKVEVRIYEGIKWEDPNPAVARVQYNIKSFSIVNGEAAGVENTDGTCIDENDEYLVLKLEDGDTATFRNSHCDMFRA